MIQVWKIPEGTDINIMRSLKGGEGSYLNPIQDIDGNWIVSEEEYNALEFQWLKSEYSDILNAMVKIDFKPVPGVE